MKEPDIYSNRLPIEDFFMMTEEHVLSVPLFQAVKFHHNLIYLWILPLQI
jgi:hypothetical protein